MHSAGKDELLVIMQPDDRVSADLRLLIKTEKYTKRKQTSSLSADEDRILRSKAAQNVEREKELVERIKRAVGSAQLVINAADVSSSSQDPLTRVTDGFQDLIARTYTQLSLLGGVAYSEQQVAGAANPDHGGMFDATGFSKLAVPGDEVLSHVLRRERLGEQVTVKALVDTFGAKPYGWDLASIEVVIAHLVGAAKVMLSVDGNTLKRSEVAAILRNTQKHPHVVVARQKSFDDRKVAAFRSFCVDFFSDPAVTKDPLELAHYGGEKVRAKLDELKARVSGSKYPFVAQLDAPIALLEQVVGKPDEWYLTEFALADELLEAKDDVIDPIQAFLNGNQRTIYDDAAKLLRGNASNLAYLPHASDTDVTRLLADPQAFRGNKMTQLKQAADALSGQIADAVKANQAEAVAEIAARRDALLGSAIYGGATDEAQADAMAQIDALIARIESEQQIAVIRELANGFEETGYPAVLDLLAAAPRETDPDEPRPPVKQTVSIKTITTQGVVGPLETPDDVDTYLAALRGSLIQALADGKRIAL